AELLQKLKRDRSGVVVFDVWFATTNQEQGDDLLAQAMKLHGRVVLPAVFAPISQPGVSGKTTLLPLPRFLEATTNWGLSEVSMLDTDLGVRRHFGGTELDPSLP